MAPPQVREQPCLHPVSVQAPVLPVHCWLQLPPGQSSEHEADPLHDRLHDPPGHENAHVAPCPHVNEQLLPSCGHVALQFPPAHWQALPTQASCWLVFVGVDEAQAASKKTKTKDAVRMRDCAACTAQSGGCPLTPWVGGR